MRTILSVICLAIIIVSISILIHITQYNRIMNLPNDQLHCQIGMVCWLAILVAACGLLGLEYHGKKIHFF